MDQFRERYYKLCKVHLILVGLWPYNISTITKVQIIACFLLFACGLVFQVLPVTGVHYTPMHIIKCASHIGMAVAYLFKYITFIYQMETIKLIYFPRIFFFSVVQQYLDIVKYDWNDVRNERELAILKEHTRMGRFYVMISALLVYVTLFAILLSPFAADVLDWIIPLNESRPRELPVRMEMFIDQETYYYLYVSILNSICLIGGLFLIAADGIMTMWLLHCCSLFAIASYRLREAFVRKSQEIHISEKSFQMSKFLASAVEMHIKATKFINRIKSNFLPTYFILLVIGILVQAVNLFLMSEAILLNKIDDIFIYGMCVFGEYCYIFYLNYIVELVMDSHKSIFIELCNTEWYEAPLRVQKIILFMMLRCSIPISFNMFNIYSISLEGFSLIMRRTMSYFAVISSVSLEN